MTFKFYLFDLDGTLLNLGNIRAYADQIFTKTLTILKAPNIPNREEKLKFWLAGKDYIKVLNKWGISKPQNFWNVYDKVDFEHRKVLIDQKKVGLFNEVKDILKKIYETANKLAIITNTAGYVVEYVLKKFNISKFFQEIFGMGPGIDEKFAKPSPKGVLSILDKFKYNPKESKAILVGDSKLDIIAAKKANIYACLIRRDRATRNKDYNEWNIQPDFIIERLDELLHLKYKKV